MPEFKYRGVLRDGKIIRGTMFSKTRNDVIRKLKNTRVQPIMVKVLKKDLLAEPNYKIDEKKLSKIQADVESQRRTAKERKQKAKGFKDITSRFFYEFAIGRIKEKDVLTFTNSLYILKKAKFNNIAAFESLFNSTQNKKLQEIVEEILIGIQAGASISRMMSMYPKVFPSLYVNFVKVGEESGSLDSALLHARDYMESNMRLKKQIRGILIPKILLFVFIILLTFAALLYGTPMIKNVYELFDVDKELPGATQFAINMAEGIIRYWYVVVITIASIFTIIRLYLRNPRGRYQWDKLKIKFPVFGRLYLNVITNKFFKAMLLNLRNGLRLQETLETSKSVTENYYFLSLIETAKNTLQAGGSWIEPFEADGAFPPMATEMLKIGMEADLVEMMDKVSEYIEQEIDESIQKTVKVLPEIMYVFIGVVLVFFVITVLVPLIDVYMGGFLMEKLP